LQKYVEARGKPVGFHRDKARVFYVKDRSATASKGVTQVDRAVYELNIETFYANPGETKGLGRVSAVCSKAGW
jgi:hypothetical protein